MNAYAPPRFGGLMEVLAAASGAAAFHFGPVICYTVRRQGKGFLVQVDYSDADNAAIESSETYHCADVLSLADVLGAAFYSDAWQHTEERNT
jgi:hypothetical protein